MAELKTKVLSGLYWTAGAKMGTQVISWASTLIVMRLLRPDDYGLLAMAGVFISLCLLLNELGLGAAIVQAKTVSDKLLRQVFGLVLALNAFFYLLLLNFNSALASIYNEPRLLEIIPILALQFLVTAFSAVPNARLSREMNFRAISIVEISAALTNSIITFSMAWTGYGLWSLVMGSLGGVTVRSIGLNYYSPFFRLPTLDMSGFAAAARFGSNITLQRILWYVYSQVDVFLIGKLLGKTSLGYYSVAVNLATLPMQKVGSILHNVGFPAYSQLQDSPDKAAGYVLKASRMLAFVAFPTFLGISVISPELVSVVLGEQWLPAIVPLQLLSLVVPLRTIQISLTPAISGMGRPDIIVRTMAVACIVMPVAFVIGLQWGITGVSMAWVIGYSLWFVFMLWQVLPVVGLSMGRFLATLWKPALFSAVMFGGVTLVRTMLGDIGLHEAVSFGLLMVTGAVIYAAGMYLFGRTTCYEIWSLLKR